MSLSFYFSLNKVAVKPMFLKNQSTNIDWFAGKDDNGQWEEYIFTVILVRIITSTSSTTKYSWILESLDDYRQKCCSLLWNN